jgi:cell division protein FtsL
MLKRTPFPKQLVLIIVSFLSLLLFTHALFGKLGYLELKKVQGQNEDLARKIEKLKAENKSIMTEIKSLKTDSRTIEKIAREELGLVRPGEIKITTSQSSDRSSTGETSPQEAP